MAQIRTVKQAPLELPTPPAETLEDGRAMSRALAGSITPTGRLKLARSFGFQLVTAWWAALTASDPKAPPLREPLQSLGIVRLTSAAQALADRIGTAAAQLEPDNAAYQIGLVYTGMLPAEQRAAHGIYYTPPAMAARLIAKATEAGADWTTVRVLDPACGGGAFLAPVAQRIVRALSGCSPRILIQNLATRLRGYELDPFGAWLSQVALDATLLPVCRAAGCSLPALVTVCDSLRSTTPKEGFDLVIGNPPYGRVTLSPADRTRFQRGLYGHANQYGLFTDLALQHARPGGIVAYVTPTSFLAGEYFKNLRALLGREAPPTAIDFVSLRKGVFDDVLQETLLATYRRGATPAPVTVHEIVPATSTGLIITEAGTIDLPADRSQPWLMPRTAAQAPLVARLAAMPHRLADWGYRVSTGPLVWNRHKSQLANAPGRNRHPLIWAEAVTSDGRFIHRADKRNHAPYFEIRSGDDWLMVNYPCVLLQRTTAKEQARRLIAAALPEVFLAKHRAVVVENHLNMLRPVDAHPPVTVEVLAAFLNSAAADRTFRCVSGSVAVSAYELEALPVPAPGALGRLRRLVSEQASRQRIEAECDRLYGGPD